MYQITLLAKLRLLKTIALTIQWQIFCVVIVLLLARICYCDGDTDSFIKGIDISHHQGVINWEMIKNANISFAFIKATEGGDVKDSLFNRNISEARKTGIAVGAYHFFTFCRPAADQVRNFIRAVPVVDGDLPPVLDVEFVGNCKKRPSITELHSELQLFIDSIVEHYGVDPIIYTTEDFYYRYKLSSFKNSLWIRSIKRQPFSGDKIDWLIWQYKVDAIPGIFKEVDYNVIRGELTKIPRTGSGKTE